MLQVKQEVDIDKVIIPLNMGGESKCPRAESVAPKQLQSGLCSDSPIEITPEQAEK